MNSIRYAVVFALAVVVLTAGAVAVFSRIGASSLAPNTPEAARDSLAQRPRAAQAGRAQVDDALVAQEDEAWRRQSARQYTLAELRARGDGRRTAREAMLDRVYLEERRGRHDLAIGELERWLHGHSDDRAAELWLARLLNEAGRTDEAVARYRALLHEGGKR
ncbi:MAG: hypothetical protein NVS4B3_00270 [Gemmatimonadaceae bacterium]